MNRLMKKEALIVEVKKYPILFDKCDKDYRNIYLKETVWRDIATRLGRDVNEIKKEWATLRGQFRKALRKKKSSSNGDAAGYISPWLFENNMEFLCKHLTKKGEHHKSSSSMKNEDDDDDDSDETEESNDESDEEVRVKEEIASSIDSISSAAALAARMRSQESEHSPPSKRKRPKKAKEDNSNSISKQIIDYLSNKQQRSVAGNEADKMFLLSLLPSLSRLPDNKKMFVRMRMMQVLYEALNDTSPTVNPMRNGAENGQQFIQPQSSTADSNQV